MRRVSLTEANPGHVLGRAVVSEQGVTLVHAGATLTPSLIERLLRVGIEAVDVAADDDDGERAAAVAALDARFEGHEDNPLMTRLKAVALRQIEQRFGGAS